MFHRLELGTTKATADNKAVLGVCDVARALGQLFGTGDGRVIYRAAAATVGAKHLRVPDQGGTRKVVALTRTVEALLRSLKTYQVCGARPLETPGRPSRQETCTDRREEHKRTTFHKTIRSNQAAAQK